MHPIDEPRPDFRTRLTGDVFHLVASAIDGASGTYLPIVPSSGHLAEIRLSDCIGWKAKQRGGQAEVNMVEKDGEREKDENAEQFR